MDVSIIIVNWNTRDLLASCLISLEFHLPETIQHEVIVVDNGSSDGSAELVKRDFPNVFLIESEDNLGFVRANNLAVAQASGRYVLLLNSDTELLDGGISDIIFYLDRHPEVGVLTGRVLYPDGSFQRPFRRFPHWLGSIFRNTIQLVVKIKPAFERKFRLEQLDQMEEHEVDWVSGAYLFIRSELVDGGKVFDEDLYMWHEDTLLCYRVRRLGYSVMYVPYAPIIHHAGMSRREIPVEASFNSYKSSAIYFKKVEGYSVARFYSMMVRIIWFLFAGVFGIAQIIPYKKFREKAYLFKNLVRMGSAL
jgi:GT2 family glycosyltransferase